MSVGDLLTDAADGDISAALEAAALAIAGLASVGVAWSLVEREEDEDVDTLPVTEVRKVTVDVDLGANGEPKGEQRLFFKPLLPRSEFVLLELRVPLGLLIEEQQLSSPQQLLLDELASGGSAPAGAAGGGAGTILVTGALPGYSAFNQVEKGDLLRAVTAYAAVAGDAPMWQQVTSGTPVGDVTSKRLIFKTDGASYANIRDAIASHRADESAESDTVTLVLERAVNASAWRESPRGARATLEPLQDVILRDLQKGAVAGVEKELDKLSVPERVGRLLSPDDDIFKR